MEPPPHQGIYAPLSQIMTDSESEEEIHNLIKHQKFHHYYHYYRHQQQQQEQQQQYQQQVNNSEQNQCLQGPNIHGRNRPNPPNTLNLQISKVENQRNLEVEHNSNFEKLHQIEAILGWKYYVCLNILALIFSIFISVNGSKKQDTVHYNTMQNTYLRSVMMSDMGANAESVGTCDAGSTFSSFNSEYDERNHTDADNVAILGGGSELTKENVHEPMSAARRSCFVASLMLCFFTVIIFVWVIPCNEDGTCPAPIDRLKAHNWLNNYTKIELKGGIHIVNGLRSWETNLIFLYRGDAFFPEFRPDNAKRNGVISLISSTGAVAWFDEMTDEPVAMDCTLVDVDRNGRPDCLIIDEYGELGTINPISGQWHWRFKERSACKVDSSDFPVILPDLDNDGVMEILVVTSVSLEQRTKHYMRQGDIPSHTTHELEQRNCLRILSGRNGRPIGEGFKIHECDTIRRLQLESPKAVTFTCIRNNTEAQRLKTLTELFALITNKSLMGQKLKSAAKISQHRHYGQRKGVESQRDVYSLSGRELVVENSGTCPDDCNVTVILSENRNGKVKILHSFTNSAMYGMAPVQWHFKNIKPNMSGFVMKFWKWTSDSGQSHNMHSTLMEGKKIRGNDSLQKSSYAKAKSGSNWTKNNTKPHKHNRIEGNNSYRGFKSQQNKRKRRHANAFDSSINEFDMFDHVVHKCNSYDIRLNPVRLKRSHTSSNVTNKKSLLMDNYQMQIITESVILMLFIGTETRTENTSQSNIVQFCRNDRAEVVCQPDLNNQENSMLIADLDQDGSEELVSYTSTFVQSADPQDWRLLSYVRLLRLQSELPLFYADEIKSNQK